MLEALCRKATIEDYLFTDLNEVSMRDEQFDDVCSLRRDLGSLIRALSKCCGTLPLLKLLEGLLNKSFNELS